MMELMEDAMGGDGFGRGGAGRRRTDGAASAWLGTVAGVVRDQARSSMGVMGLSSAVMGSASMAAERKMGKMEYWEIEGSG
ncbi:hypothetical protein ACLOJK_012400 [Asimina triloba]